MISDVIIISLILIFGLYNLLSELSRGKRIEIQCWVARDESGELHLFGDKPYSKEIFGDEIVWLGEERLYTKLDESYFPELTYKDEPKKIKMILIA